MREKEREKDRDHRERNWAKAGGGTGSGSGSEFSRRRGASEVVDRTDIRTHREVTDSLTS